jgi:3-phytase
MLKFIYPLSIVTFSAIFILIQGCSSDTERSLQDGESINEQAITLTEVFHTNRDEGDNVDSPAVWHGPDSQHWLLATAKEGNTIIAYDASDGTFIERFGDGGSEAGQFERPNGIAVIDDMVLVVERDNRRVQVFSLPEFESMGFFTHEDLRLPYGLTVFKNDSGTYHIYVTDNFNPYLEGYPAMEELDERIHHFRFTATNGQLESEHINLFGDTAGQGILHKVESIYADPRHNRILIADEAFSERSVKIYSLDGRFTGEVIPNTYFMSEPEGIALYSCEDGSGYWIITDQHPDNRNIFQVFDRESLEYIGGFKGEITRNTDGIWLTQKAFGNFESGALYPVHDDGSVTAFSWQDIAGALNLDRNCSL